MLLRPPQQSEPGFVGAAVRPVSVAISRTAAPRPHLPTTAPLNPAGPRCWSRGISHCFRIIIAAAVQILAPLPHISRHIVKSPGIGGFLNHRMGFGIRIIVIPTNSIHVRILASVCFRYLPIVKGCGSTRPRRIFPLCFRRQSVRPFPKGVHMVNVFTWLKETPSTGQVGHS
jgi:hypothetical protein